MSSDGLQRVLHDLATRYIYGERIRAASLHLLGRGKLFRPELALAACRAVAGPDAPSEAELLAMVAPLELIHTFTLIHDDLPCMDDAQLRRGVPAVHLAYDEATAVLAGDALCDMAFQVLATEPAEVSDRQRLDLIAALSEATQWVVAGQELDLAAEGAELSLEALVGLQQRKTGALLGACCEFGSVLAGQGRSEPLRRVGWRIGLLFQIRDDLLAVESTEAQAGKTLDTDASKLKSTLVRALGVEGAQELAERTLAEVTTELHAMGLKQPELLEALASRAYRRDS